MKFFKLSLIMILFLFVCACKSDDESTTCVQNDWLGIYEGIIYCVDSSPDSIEDVTVTITASGSDAIVLKYETPNNEVMFIPFIPDECNILNNTYTTNDMDTSLLRSAFLYEDTLQFSYTLRKSMNEVIADCYTNKLARN